MRKRYEFKRIIKQNKKQNQKTNSKKQTKIKRNITFEYISHLKEKHPTVQMVVLLAVI